MVGIKFCTRACIILTIIQFSLAPRINAANQPNILWLVGEDLGPHLACYGTKEVSTPNLDRLAATGMRFTGCYNGHVCSPSRSSFMTGMYAVTLNANNHRTSAKRPLPDGVHLLTDWFRPAGYFTGNIKTLPDPCGFNGTAKTDWNFSYQGKPYDTNQWVDLKNHQPFYAQINFSETHRPYHAPKHADPTKVEIPPYYPDHPVTRADWAAYLDDITELDRKIGIILNQLEQDNLADHTIIVFFGDNGQSHVRGKQFCYEEGQLVPLIIHWPKNLPAPNWYHPATTEKRLLEGVDLAAISLECAGVPIPPNMQGQPLSAPAKNYVFGARDRCDETVMKIRAVRDAQFRYIRNLTPQTPWLAPNAYKESQYPVWNLLKQLHNQGKLTPAQDLLCQPQMPPEELYDLTKDPWEIHNLATDPSHVGDLTRLRAKLDQWTADCDHQTLDK